MNRGELLAAAAAIANFAAEIVKHVAEDAATDPDELVLLVDAARIARVSERTLRTACRSGDPPSYGKQRTRTIRRADLMAWIEAQRAPVTVGVYDADMARRMRRLRAKKTKLASAGLRATRRTA